MGRAETTYRNVEGMCLAAILALRRFDGSEALDNLKSAIRTIEAENSRARREDRTRFDRVPSPHIPIPMDPIDF